MGTLDVPTDRIRILNLGTCDPIDARASSLDTGGLWQWRNSAVEVILRGQSISVAKHLRFLLGDQNFLRIDPPVPAGFLSLDSFQRSSDLIGKAAHYSRTYMPQLAKAFLDHHAPEFVPIYKEQT